MNRTAGTSPEIASAAPRSGFEPGLLLALAAFLVVVGASYYRLYFGLNFADEAYYIAIPLRFVLGDVPFRDEATTLFSMFSFISYPFFKLFHAVTGSSDGIVLFARHLYFALSLAVAAVLYRIARQLTGRAEALLIAGLAVAFVPFNIQGISYNSLSGGLLAAGLFAAAWSSRAQLGRYAALSGFLLTLSVVAYPPLLVAALVALVCLLVQYRKALPAACLGILAALLCLAPLLRYVQPDLVRNNLEYVSSIGAQGGSWHKLVSVLKNSFSHLRVGLVLGALACTALARRPAPMTRTIAALVPVLLFLTNKFPKESGVTLAHGFVLALALTGPWLYQGLDRVERRFSLSVWLPSAAAALVMGYCSSNGYLNSGIGFLAGALVSLAALALLLAKGSQAEPSRWRLQRLAMLAATGAILVYYQYASFYWESPLGKLTSTVASGPYKYLHTTPEKTRFIAELAGDVKEAAQGRDSVVFYYDFPAGYLFSDLRTASNAVWQFSPHLFPGVNTGQLERRYQLPQQQPDVVFRLSYAFLGELGHDAVVRVPGHPIDRLLASGNYRTGPERSEYVVYCKNRRL